MSGLIIAVVVVCFVIAAAAYALSHLSHSLPAPTQVPQFPPGPYLSFLPGGKDVEEYPGTRSVDSTGSARIMLTNYIKDGSFSWEIRPDGAAFGSVVTPDSVYTATLSARRGVTTVYAMLAKGTGVKVIKDFTTPSIPAWSEGVKGFTPAYRSAMGTPKLASVNMADIKKTGSSANYVWGTVDGVFAFARK